MRDERVIRLGVAGLGRAFSLMLPTFLADRRVELVAACDPRKEARDQFVRDFDAPAYQDIEALARDDRVEVIYIATPHQFHEAHVRVAAAHRRHVLVEKPMALTLGQCDAMIADCAAAGVRLVVGHCHSFDSPYLAARQIVASGEVGRVRMIQALNYTDFLYRPRRPEELDTAAGGGVVFSQAAHQVDIVRMLAGSPVVRVRAVLGAWDPARPTEGAYSALLWFEDGAFASLAYSGYAHFDSDQWCGDIGEMGNRKQATDYGSARRRLALLSTPQAEAAAKAQRAYGGTAYQQQSAAVGITAQHQHFGPIIVSCERGDLRPVPDGVWVYGDARRELRPLPLPAVPRFEVIDELQAAIDGGVAPFHDGVWARATLQVCLALLESAREQRDVELSAQGAQP